VYTLTRGQIEELRTYLPIPHGGLKLIAGIGAILGIATGTLWISNLAVGAGFSSAAVATGIAAIITVAFGACWFEWFVAAYLQCNVRGFVARFTLSESETITGGTIVPIVSHVIRKRKEDKEDRHRARFHSDFPGGTMAMISLPLGGWFTTSAIFVRDLRHVRRGAIAIFSQLRGWSVRLLAILDTVGTVTVEIRRCDRTRNKGERITCDAERALRYLEEIATMEIPPTSVSEYLWRKAQQCDDARSELMEFLEWLTDAGHFGSPQHWEGDVQKKLPPRYTNRQSFKHWIEQRARLAIEGRAEATAFIGQLDERFEQSDRLHDKLQALGIHRVIINWLCDRRVQEVGALTDTDACAIALARVRRRIAEAEKRNALRHKRGKPATPPAP